MKLFRTLWEKRSKIPEEQVLGERPFGYCQKDQTLHVKRADFPELADFNENQLGFIEEGRELDDVLNCSGVAPFPAFISAQKLDLATWLDDDLLKGPKDMVSPREFTFQGLLRYAKRDRTLLFQIVNAPEIADGVTPAAGSGESGKGDGTAVIPGPRVNAARLRMGIDGMILQHVGELFFLDALTGKSRRHCRKLYLRCLEDFVFALIYAQVVEVAPNLARVRGEKQSPADLVIAHLHDFVERSAPAKTGAVGENAARDVLMQQLRTLRDWPADQETFRRDLLLREATLYLGEHDSVRMGKPPFLFQRDPPYIEDQQLASEVAPLAVRDDVARISSFFKNCSPFAIEAFVRQFWVTHLTIGDWYRQSMMPSWRLQVVTRTIAQQNARAFQPRVALLRSTLVRKLLNDLSAASVGNREEVLVSLVTQARDERHDGVRAKLTRLDDAIREPSTTADEINRLCAQIEELAADIPFTLRRRQDEKIMIVQEPFGELTTTYKIFPELTPTADLV